MYIGLDIDGVLRDVMTSLITTYKRVYPDHWTKPVISWSLHEFFEIGEGIYEFMFELHPWSIFVNASPYPGALEMVGRLGDLLGHKVCYVTTQPERTQEPTRVWLTMKKFSQFGPVFFAEDKSTVEGYDILLEDAVHNLEAVTKAGRRAICMDRPWNQDWRGERVRTYDEFLETVGVVDD